jgi:hypothetical protein
MTRPLAGFACTLAIAGLSADLLAVLGYRFEPGQEITRGAGYRSPAA